MKHYDPQVVREAVKRILADDWRPSINEPPGWNREDALLSMFSAMTYTLYGAGMREVQQGVIKALDLRHLLGLH